jgi:hypothetical protein
MKNIKVAFFSLFLLSSCATIFTGTRDVISFNSTPQGAMIYKDGVELCKTPCSFPMKRDFNDVSLQIKLDGYQTRVFKLDKQLNVVSVLNLGNLLGWGIDALSGSLLKYDRKQYDLVLEKDKMMTSIRPSQIMIDTKEKVVTLMVN